MSDLLNNLNYLNNLNNIIDNNEYIKNCISNQKKDFYSLSYLINSKLSQSDCIKLGIGLEKCLIDIIQNYNNKLINIKEKNEKNIKEKDHLFKDEINKIIFYTEIKANLKLDTEKTKSTINKCLEIKNILEKTYPDYEIKMSLLYLRFYTKKNIPVYIMKKFDSIKNYIVGINDYFQILGINIQFNNENEFKYFINYIVKKMFKFDEDNILDNKNSNFNNLDSKENISENENKNSNLENKEQKQEIKKLKKNQLIELCKKYKIKNYSNKNKDELINLISLINLYKNNHDESKLNNLDMSNNLNNSNMSNISNNLNNSNNSHNKIHLTPLIKWSGGKSDEIKYFEQFIPQNYKIYLEPFIGGGSLYFYLNPENAVINDVHKELIDFYQCIAEGKSNEIYKFMQENKNDETTYYKIRDYSNNLDTENNINHKLENAKTFYYQRKTCYRGMLRYNKDGKFNIPFGKYKSINYEILKNNEYEKLLSKTEILNKSYEYIFENYNDENNFMFLDPPYDSEFTDYGYCKFDKKEQEKLSILFKSTKIKCLMIIGKTDYIVSLYKDYIKGEYDKKYKFKLYGNRIGNEINNKHLIICNYL